jgi:hypothetical protein
MKGAKEPEKTVSDEGLVIWKKKKDYNKLVKNLKLENRPFKQ